jgi:hypothetical protein
MEDYLYIHGGNVSFLRDGKLIYTPGMSMSWNISHMISNRAGISQVNTSLSIPLASSWTNQSLKMIETAKHEQMPHFTGPSMWMDDTTQSIILWGEGQDGSNTYLNSTKLWKLSVDGAGGGIWQFQDPRDVTEYATLQHASESLYSTCAGAGIALGGVMQASTLVPGLLTYNLTTREFNNETAQPFTIHGTDAAGDSMCLSNFGQNGLVLFLGGFTNNDLDWWTFNEDGPGLVSFDNITLYDPITKEWYSQTTTGNRPAGREGFCASGIQSPDGSYEV